MRPWRIPFLGSLLAMPLMSPNMSDLLPARETPPASRPPARRWRRVRTPAPPMNGARETARRRRQIASGQITASNGLAQEGA